MTVSHAQVDDTARRYTAAWCSHDASAVASFYSEDGRIVINEGEPSIGREGITAMAAGFFAAFPDLIVKMDQLRSSGTHAVFLWTLSGTNSGTGGSGNRVEVSGWEYWRLNGEGKVVESAGHFDAADYERQLAGG